MGRIAPGQVSQVKSTTDATVRQPSWACLPAFHSLWQRPAVPYSATGLPSGPTCTPSTLWIPESPLTDQAHEIRSQRWKVDAEADGLTSISLNWSGRAPSS